MTYSPDDEDFMGDPKGPDYTPSPASKWIGWIGVWVIVIAVVAFFFFRHSH